jgi:hypothetical protein
MNTKLSFGLMFAAAGVLFACSDDGTPRPSGSGGTGTTNGGSGGTGTTNGGTTSTGGGGSGQGGSGTVGPPTGAALTINADGTVVDTAGDSGINGAALVAFSAMNPAHVMTPADGRLCFNGATAQVVPTPASAGNPDYDAYWGAGVYVDLNRGANPNATDAGAGDAGDAGGGEPGMVGLLWDPAPGNVVGFQFVLEGQDPTIMPDQGVPPEMRLQARPDGEPQESSACKNLPATGKHNAVQNVLFDEMVFLCYNAAGQQGRALFGDPLPGTRRLYNIGFQVNANTAIAYQFNFCIRDIKPILAEAP